MLAYHDNRSLHVSNSDLARAGLDSRRQTFGFPLFEDPCRPQHSSDAHGRRMLCDELCLLPAVECEVVCALSDHLVDQCMVRSQSNL